MAKSSRDCSVRQLRQPRRGAGRPQAGDLDARQTLLDAALTCFARNGIASTSIRDLTRQAGVTPAVLHYHFGGKPQLLDALIAERMLPVLAAVRQPLLQAGDSLPALVGGFVRGMMAVIRDNPWLPPLWVREVLCEGGALRDLLVNTVGPQLPVQLAERFAQAQCRGELPKGVDPRLLVASLVGLTLFPAAGMPVWQQLFDAPHLGEEAIGRHALALLGQGLGGAILETSA